VQSIVTFPSTIFPTQISVLQWHTHTRSVLHINQLISKIHLSDINREGTIICGYLTRRGQCTGNVTTREYFHSSLNSFNVFRIQNSSALKLKA